MRRLIQFAKFSGEISAGISVTQLIYAVNLDITSKSPKTKAFLGFFVFYTTQKFLEIRSS